MKLSALHEYVDQTHQPHNGGVDSALRHAALSQRVSCSNFSAHNPSAARQIVQITKSAKFGDYREEKESEPVFERAGATRFFLLPFPPPLFEPCHTHRREKGKNRSTLFTSRHFFWPNMAAATERFLHLARPLAHTNIGLQTNIAPLTVQIQPQVYNAPSRENPSRLPRYRTGRDIKRE